jgi:hypothetical protein
MTPVPRVAVALAVPDLAVLGEIVIGLLMPPLAGEGAEYRDAVEGAAVAAYRFGLGQTQVVFQVALDDGTAAGAVKALEDLLARKAAGIVVASSGPHLDAMWQAAAVSDTAVIAPYDRPAGQFPGVWLTGPSQATVNTQLAAALAQAGARRPFAVTAPGVRPVQLDQTVDAAWEDPALLAEQAVSALETGAADSIVVTASAQQQGQLAAAIQGRLGDRQAPLFFSPEALTPVFAQILLQTGSVHGLFATVGPKSGDQMALDGAAGRHTAAFFDALRLAAGNPASLNVFGDAPFSSVAQTADLPSHDAVVALVRAAAAAGSTEAAAVKSALAKSRLDGEDGLAGPPLDFSQAAALAADSVVTLHASASDPGLRPAAADAAATSLHWFTTG